jgi:hypothetical protein
MSTNEQQAQALDIANEIVRLSREIKLTGQPDLAEDEIKAYAELMDTREPLVAQLTSLLMGMDDKTFIKKTMTDLLSLDKSNQEIIQHIKTHLQSSIKDINDGQHLHNIYAAHADNGSTGLLDTKK